MCEEDKKDPIGPTSYQSMVEREKSHFNVFVKVSSPVPIPYFLNIY